jgi:hypothetical protein
MPAQIAAPAPRNITASSHPGDPLTTQFSDGGSEATADLVHRPLVERHVVMSRPPNEPAADGSAKLDLLAGAHPREIGRDLSVGVLMHGELDALAVGVTTWSKLDTKWEGVSPDTLFESIAVNVDSEPLAEQSLQLSPCPPVLGAELVSDCESPVVEVDARSRPCLQDREVRGQMLTGWQLGSRFCAAPAKAFVDDSHWCSPSW